VGRDGPPRPGDGWGTRIGRPPSSYPEGSSFLSGRKSGGAFLPIVMLSSLALPSESRLLLVYSTFFFNR
jgi:hypothetical protein